MTFSRGISGTATRMSSEWRTVSNPAQTDFGGRPYLSQSELAESDLFECYPGSRFLFVSSMPMMRVIRLGMPRFAMNRGIFFGRGKNGGSEQFSGACACQEWDAAAAGR